MAARARSLAHAGQRLLPLTDPDYPGPLAELLDAPPVLIGRGDLGVLSTPSVAIIGARAATQVARGVARRLARDLASWGLTIVSGLARGIDAEAHRGALEAGGRTVGVLACGPGVIYPPEHRGLAEDMIASGAIVTEMPPGVPPRRELFPLRNRIISGLCLAVIVVEARRRSGSLITVRHALAQGREVFVVPGGVEGPFAEGTNQLLRDGARAVQTARHVIEDLGLDGLDARRGESGTRPERQARLESSGEEDSVRGRVLAALARGPATRAALLALAGLDAGRLAEALLELELAGRIVEERDGRIHARWG